MKDNAPFFDMPNDMKPENYNTHFVYSSIKIPNATNTAAKTTNSTAVMNAVMDAK